VIAGGTLAAVLLATALPAWRAARVLPAPGRVPAPAGHLSRLARTALLTRLPPAVVLGARAAFIRRVPAVLTIGGMALPMLMITIGLAFWSTLSGVQSDPAGVGLAAPVTVAPGLMTVAAARRVIAADRSVTAVYPSVQIGTLLPGENSAITALAIGDSRRPYPFHVAAGQIYHSPDQAVASEGLLMAAHLKVGELIRITIGGVPVGLMITGRIIEPEYGGRVLAFGLDALSQAGAAAPPISYSLVLRSGVSPAAARDRLLAMSGSRLQVTVTANPADQLGVVRVLLAGLIVVLGLIGVTNLITTSAVGLRDHLRDVGALRALGLTPRQVLASLVTRTGVLALIAAGSGAAAGLILSTRLINLGGQAYGIGSGIASPPTVTAAVAEVVIAVTVAVLTVLIPARRAARAPIAALLGP
jgi:putative ABC transport system permease protein